MTILELKEYERSEAVGLSADQIRDLRRVAPSVTVEPSHNGSGLYHLTPRSEIGVVHLGAQVLWIRPKIPVERVLFLIAYAIDPVRWTDQLSEFAVERSLVEALVPAFVAHVRRALRGGSLWGYLSEEAALQTIRGRLSFEEQLRRRQGRFPPAEVRFDEFTEDIDENRLIKAALVRLGRMEIRSPVSRQALRNFDAILSSVALIGYHPARLPDVRYTWLNSHYRPAVELAKLILRSFSFEHEAGRAPAWAFLVDMNRVFESFVVIALREALGLDERSWPRGCAGHFLTLDKARTVVLSPDLSWWDGYECGFVGDAKYKHVEITGVNHPDLYQLLAYTVATDLPAGLLIYAAGEGERAVHRTVHLGKTLEVIPLGLDGTPEAILQEVRRLAVRVQAIRQLRKAERGRPAVA